MRAGSAADAGGVRARSAKRAMAERERISELGTLTRSWVLGQLLGLYKMRGAPLAASLRRIAQTQTAFVGKKFLAPRIQFATFLRLNNAYAEMKRLLATTSMWLMAIFAADTYALLGETLEQSIVRYGRPANNEPIRLGEIPGVNVYVFERPSGKITVMLRDKKTVGLLYEHADPDKFNFEKAENILKNNHAAGWKLDTETTADISIKTALAGAGETIFFWTAKGAEGNLLAFYRTAQGRLVLGDALVVGQILGF
jgi:hypothetical protein